MSVDVQMAPPTNGLTNGHGEDGEAKPNGTPTAAPRFATGIILPPPETKSIIDRTATAVARSALPEQFEDKIREAQRSDPKFSFLNPADPYHAYYRNKMVRVAQGEEEVAKPDAPKAETPMEEVKITSKPGIVPLEPTPPDFILDLPPISAVDLDIIKTTALFTARRGRSFLQALATKEARNFEFDFLRPTSSLFGLFNTLVEQYSKVLYPSKESLEKLKSRTEEDAKWKILEISRQHAEWERIKREKEKKKQDDKEAERIAFAEIDWHDYAIVQTIEFTAVDANSELPPPMTMQELVDRTLAQKKMAAMIMEDTVDEVEAIRARQAEEAETAPVNENVEMTANGAAARDADQQMDVSDDDEELERHIREEEERQRELDRAREVQAQSADTIGPMKIRTDYVPKLKNKGEKVTMTTCSICGQQIPVDELQEHMRIELLDPRWKSQRDQLEARRAQLNELQRGANVESSLKQLARARVDIFGTELDEEKRKREEQAELERRKEREKNVWDGHTASKEKTLDKFQSNSNIDEQIAAIHRAKGLAGVESNIGPGIGPSSGPGLTPSLPPPPPSLPANPKQVTIANGGMPGAPDPAFATATVSAGPQPASMYGGGAASIPMPGPPVAPGGPPTTTAPGAAGVPAPVMLPPLHYQGLDSATPFGFSPPPTMTPPVPMPGVPPGMHPSRLAALGTPPIGGIPPGPSPGIGMVRSASDAALSGEGVGDGTSGADDSLLPPAKRQRVARLPGGQFYPEQHWVEMHPHPISVQIQLPEDGTRPEWKLDGSVVTLSDIPVTYTVSSLREALVRHTGTALPVGKVVLSYNGTMLTNRNSLASYNVEDEDLLVLSVRDQKKKK